MKERLQVLHWKSLSFDSASGIGAESDDMIVDSSFCASELVEGTNREVMWGEFGEARDYGVMWRKRRGNRSSS